ncbi:hypothetical protein BDZ45DRAFT_669339 [Acephala macrosclerotiorum]|nr:hypothetical protein BDZ45DRAFT_669339 [Acephala macrosclerotiorum]
MASIHVITDLQRSYLRALDLHMQATTANNAENDRVTRITEPVRMSRDQAEEALSALRSSVEEKEARLSRAFTQDDQARAVANRQARSIAAARLLGRRIKELDAFVVTLRYARSAVASKENEVKRFNDDLNQLSGQYEEAKVQRIADIGQLHEKAEEIRQEMSPLEDTVRALWGRWSAEQRIHHFEIADFDFGLFGEDTPYLNELLQAYAEARPQFAPPRVGLLEVLISWVKDGLHRRPNQSFLYEEIRILRRTSGNRI